LVISKSAAKPAFSTKPVNKLQKQLNRYLILRFPANICSKEQDSQKTASNALVFRGKSAKASQPMVDIATLSP
jgi:hypothetical protein